MNPDRLATAREAAKAAGTWLEEALWNPHEARSKGDYDLSLDADDRAEALIRRILTRDFPGESVLAEGHPLPEGAPPFVWIVDPLDGTVNYHHRLPWFCVSIACYARAEASDHPLWTWGRPLVSVVYAPLLKQEFFSRAGAGAWCGDRRLAVGNEGLKTSLLAYSRGSKAGDQRFMKQFLDEVGHQARKTRSHGAAALDLAYVAQGSLGALAQRSLQPWDVAAGVHLVLEAGGLAHLRSDESDGHHVLAASPGVYAQLEGLWTQEGA